MTAKRARSRSAQPAPSVPCPDCGWKPKSGDLWPSEGALAVRWIEGNLIHGEGDFYGRPFKLRLDQKAFLWEWYSYCGGCDQWQYTQGLKGAATGDGKTEFIAAIACLEFAGPSRIAVSSPNIVIAAASYEQAGLLFGKAATMLGGRDCQGCPAPLCGLFIIYDTEITFRDGSPGVVRRVAAVAGTNEGGLPSLFLCDEVHEWGDVGSRKARVHTVINKSRNKRMTPRGTGRNLNLSTAGFDKDHSLLGEICAHGERVQLDRSFDPYFLMDWRQSDPNLDLDDPKQRAIAVQQASAAAGVQWSVDARVREWDKPGVPHHEWIRYYGNRWVDIAEDSWLVDDPGAWDDCKRPNVSIPKRGEVVLAVDMALKRDSAAVSTLHRLKNDRVVIRTKIWQPTDRKIDHLAIKQHILDQADLYDVLEVTYDPRLFEVLALQLEDEGMNMVEFPQSVERMTPACGLALEKIRGRNVCHDGDVDLGSHVKAAAKRPNERGFTLSKGKSKRQIDAAITLCIGIYRLFAPDEVEDDLEPWVAYS